MLASVRSSLREGFHDALDSENEPAHHGKEMHRETRPCVCTRRLSLRRLVHDTGPAQEEVGLQDCALHRCAGREGGARVHDLAVLRFGGAPCVICQCLVERELRCLQHSCVIICYLGEPFGEKI